MAPGFVPKWLRLLSCLFVCSFSTRHLHVTKFRTWCRYPFQQDSALVTEGHTGEEGNVIEQEMAVISILRRNCTVVGTIASPRMKKTWDVVAPREKDFYDPSKEGIQRDGK